VKRLLVAVLVLAVCLGVAPQALARTRTLAPGATVTSLRWRHERIHYVKLNLDRRSIGSVPHGSRLPLGLRTTKGQGLASVAADFRCKDMSGSQPCGLYVRRREVWTTGRGGGGVSYVQGKNQARIDQSAGYFFIRGEGNRSTRIMHVNYGHDGVVAFNPRGGVIRPTPGRCYMKLGKPGGWSVTKAGGDQRTYRVVRKRCGSPLSVDHGIVIESNVTLDYRVGDQVAWVQDFGIPNVTSVVSGMTQVVRNGVNLGVKKFGGHDGPDGYYYNDCPRTVLALRGSTAFMVVVDGLPSNRAGIKFPKLGTFLVQHLHADAAFNLDGGGSAALWTKKFGLVSNPSYGFIRSGIYATTLI